MVRGSKGLSSLLTVSILSCMSVAAQVGPTLAAVGYQDPQWQMVAPGQVITFFITGATIVLPHSGNQDAVVGASRLPLPTSLAGFSLGLSQLGSGLIPLPPYSMGPILLPIFSIEQTNRCIAAQTPDCLVTAITVEILPDLQMPLSLNLNNSITEVTIMQHGLPGSQFSLAVLPARMRQLLYRPSGNRGQ